MLLHLWSLVTTQILYFMKRSRHAFFANTFFSSAFAASSFSTFASAVCSFFIRYDERMDVAVRFDHQCAAVVPMVWRFNSSSSQRRIVFSADAMRFSLEAISCCARKTGSVKASSRFWHEGIHIMERLTCNKPLEDIMIHGPTCFDG